MKNLKFLAVILIVALGIVLSCTKEESISESYNSSLVRKGSEVDSMATYYSSVVMRSEKYANLQYYIVTMSDKLNNLGLDLKNADRSAFAEWMSRNLSKTDFATVEEALSLWDRGYESAGLVESEFSTFYSSLNRFTKDERLKIFIGEFIPTPVAQQDCEQPCLELHSISMANAANEYAEAIQGGNWFTIWLAGWHRDCAEQAATNSFNYCLDQYCS